ncbi:MAG TPA: 30S ribosomal protein S16 [Sedimentisphaerales bacterium]|nr:30S ribosomal protein S16 [Sedimentisphaerales bacterium]
MAVKLRMTRMGRRHRPFFRINAVDARTPRDGKIIEKLGHYDPIEKDKAKQIVLNRQRVEYWLQQGAIPSETVSQILLRAGIKHKCAEVRTARRAKARAAARAKGRFFTKAEETAAQKAAEKAKAKAEAEAKQAQEKAKAEAKAAEEKAKAEAEAKAAEEKAKAEAEAKTVEEAPTEAEQPKEEAASNE